MNENVLTNLSLDTEAILLLCGRFGSERGESYSPLTQKEYERLAKWLIEGKLRPSDLIGGALTDRFGELVNAGLEPHRIKSLISRGTAMALSLEKWQRSGLWVLSRSDAAYPKRLKKKLGQSAPPLLYGAGDTSLLDIGGLAVVGSRNVTEASLEYTREVGSACAKDGMGVISGGAKGVDAAGMQGAGEAGGMVIGVLAADLLRASVNRQNRMGIQSGKLVLTSPFNPDAGFNTGNAMARNRFIYALADYALVVESAEGEGGTWAGAIENLRHGWSPLFVRTPSESPGNAALIAKGGKGFDFDVANSSSIREYFEKHTEPKTPIPIQNLVENGISETVENIAVVPERIEEASTSPVIEIKKDKREQTPARIETFEDFIKSLIELLGDSAKNAADIRLALGLDNKQFKVWLAAAVDQGIIEKKTKPVAYTLSRQQVLC